MDPRITTPEQRKAQAGLSDLQLAKQGNLKGEKTNRCPFGCSDEELDERGYCHHLVGFTNDGKVMECMEKDERGRFRINGSKIRPVLDTDKKDRVTVSSRVYRNVDAKQAKAS